MEHTGRASGPVGHRAVDWPVAAIAGAGAGLLRPTVVAVVETLGASPGPLALALQSTLPHWWAFHLGYSALFGVGFALLVGSPPLAAHARRHAGGAILGCAYGLALWTVGVLVVWQFLLGPLVLVTDTSTALEPGPALGHLAYGTLLGVSAPLWIER